MEYNHYEKIIETYQKLLKMTNSSRPNKELLKTVLDLYEFAYDAGEHEEHQRVHYFFRQSVDEEKLLKQCHGEIPLYEEDDDEDE